jgi:RNA polymerase sigma factor (sigma-70 family)
MSMLAERLEPRAAETARGLFEAHRRRIFGFCLSQLGNHHEAEDAVQTTFLYAFSCLERGVVPESELAWLFKIALNVCRTRRRSLGRRRRIETPTDLDACEYAMAAPERAGDDLLGLSGALAAMPIKQRDALLLREWQGLSYAEIADRLTISHSAVETLLFRARRTLASELRRIPQQVAVIANVPLLLRVVRRLSPGTTAALKTTAAIVAIGAVAGVSGHEVAPRHADPAPPPARSSSHGNATIALHSSVRVSHRRVQTEHATRVARVPAPATAAPAATATESSSAPAVSPVPDSPQQVAPASPGPAAAPKNASPPAATPTVPAQPPTTPVGELPGDVVTQATDVVQTVTSQVPPVSAVTDAVGTAAANATTAVSSAVQTVSTAVPSLLPPKP